MSPTAPIYRCTLLSALALAVKLATPKIAAFDIQVGRPQTNFAFLETP